MPSVDSYNNVYGDLAIPLLEYYATTTSAAIDIEGFNSLTFFIVTGTVTGAEIWTASIVECATVDGTYTPVDPEFIVGVYPTFTGGSTSDNSVLRVGYVGNEPFVKLVLTPSAAADAFFTAIAVLGAPRSGPTPINLVSGT